MTRASADGRRASLVWPGLVALAAVVVYLNTLGNGFAPEAVNVGLHAVVSALAWFALRRAGIYYGTALLGALLFAVHPVHVEAVTHVAGRPELLAAAGVLAAWLSHRRASEAHSSRSRGAWTLTATLLYFLAILSEERAILAPALFIADDLHRAKEAGGYRAARAGRSMALYGAAFLAALLLRAGALPTVQDPSDPRLLTGLTSAIAAITIAAYGWRRSRPLFLGAILFLATGTLMGAPPAYLPSLGFCLLAGHLGAWIASIEGPRQKARQATVLALAATTLIALGTCTWHSNPTRTNNTSAVRSEWGRAPGRGHTHFGPRCKPREQRLGLEPGRKLFDGLQARRVDIGVKVVPVEKDRSDTGCASAGDVDRGDVAEVDGSLGPGVESFQGDPEDRRIRLFHADDVGIDDGLEQPVEAREGEVSLDLPLGVAHHGEPKPLFLQHLDGLNGSGDRSGPQPDALVSLPQGLDDRLVRLERGPHLGQDDVEIIAPQLANPFPLLDPGLHLGSCQRLGAGESVDVDIATAGFEKTRKIVIVQVE